MSRADLVELQQRKLREVFAHICATPFYRQKLSGMLSDGQYGISRAALSQLPFTYKEELRLTSPMARTPLSVSDLIAFFSSSGTTGEPSVYAWSRTDQQVYEEVSVRLLRNIGVGPGDVALLPLRMGMPLSWYAILSEMRAVGAAVVPLGAVPLEEIARALVRYPITILKTSPVVASRLFRFIAETDSSLLSRIRLRQIHLAGFFSSNARKKRLSEQWSADCYDMYGLSEFGLVGGECRVREGQHVCADYVLVETLAPENQRPVSAGQAGVAVYTALWKKGAPLLRYWSNDYIVMDDAPCGCGLDLPRLTFRGRDIDSVVLDGWRVFASDVEEVLLGYDGVGEEFLVEICGRQNQFRCVVQVEAVGHVPTASLEEHLGAFFHAPVQLQILPPYALDRTSPKPLRIIDHRERAA